ncbi:hypothetical protein BDZ94DRAFT_1209062 [Collybia nuda]|uniref:FAD-binding domain-containing protein n=1 Tax=Collybia nuda TaxID=64659 RepID=A0A9P6CJF4_9AGAR|nr:hypothetical protein BDZ94DRAFT_1209062 [Collybia nuda]
MSSVISPKFKVAICGAGITGLALAAFLSSAKNSSDIQIDIYESKKEVSADGSGIAVWKRTWQVLKQLGFEKDCTERNIRTPQEGESSGPIFRRSDTPDNAIDFHSHIMPYGPMFLSRPQLLEVLQTKLNSDNCKIHTSKKVTTYELASNSIKIRFADGSDTTADVFLGCDGVHSNVRATLFAHDSALAKPIFSGQLAYRSMCKQEDIVSKSPDHPALTQTRAWCGSGKHVISNPFIHPATGQKFINIVCFDNIPGGPGVEFEEWSAKVDVEEIQKLFVPGEWEDNIITLLAASEPPTRWAVHVVQPLPYFGRGTVAVLGDAAHAMTPHQGIGAGQGIEDALFLGRLLTHPTRTRDNVPILMEIYNEMRVKPAQRAVDKSRRTGEMYDLIQLKGEGMDLKKLGEAIGTEFSWLGLGGVEEDWMRAEGMLKEKLGLTKTK